MHFVSPPSPTPTSIYYPGVATYFTARAIVPWRVLVHLDKLGLHGLQLSKQHPFCFFYLSPLRRLFLQPGTQGFSLVGRLSVRVQELLHVLSRLGRYSTNHVANDLRGTFCCVAGRDKGLATTTRTHTLC